MPRLFLMGIDISEGYVRSAIYVHSQRFDPALRASHPKLDCLGSMHQRHQTSVTAHHPVQAGCSGQCGS
jgi:hypothetical protein